MQANPRSAANPHPDAPRRRHTGFAAFRACREPLLGPCLDRLADRGVRVASRLPAGRRSSTSRITGLSGPEAATSPQKPRSAARDTDHIARAHDQLRSVVEPYPGRRARPSGRGRLPPRSWKITIIENTPVAVVVAGGEKTPVAGDGRLLRGAEERQLPTVPVSVVPERRSPSRPRSPPKPSPHSPRRPSAPASASYARPRPSTAASRSSCKTVPTFLFRQ